MQRLAPLLLLAAVPASASETLQARLIASARAVGPESVAFTRTTRTEQRTGPNPDIHTRVERYDPRRPPAQRWTLVSLDGRTPTSDEMVNMAERTAEQPVPGYHRLARWLGAKAACDDRVCRYASLPKGAFLVNGHDASAATSAEVTAGAGDTPWVERIRFQSAKGFRLMLVAKVDKVEATQAFTLLPGGIPAMTQSEVMMTGSMMGKAGSMRVTTTYTDLRPVSPSR